MSNRKQLYQDKDPPGPGELHCSTVLELSDVDFIKLLLRILDRLLYWYADN